MMNIFFAKMDEPTNQLSGSPTSHTEKVFTLQTSN